MFTENMFIYRPAETLEEKKRYNTILGKCKKTNGKNERRI